ncbi:AMP binding protein [Wallemia mellicola]|nr:AMP binding protein [Wallemia mellicola]
MLFYLFQRGRSVILPKFEINAFGAAIEKYKVTVTSLVPPIIVLLANTDIDKKYNFSSLRLLQVGAAPLGEEVTKKIAHKFNDVITIAQGYGLTETTPVTHKMSLEYAKSHSGYIGRLLPNTIARVVDENGRDVPGDNKSSGDPRLWIKGPQVMKGYLNRPDATAECMTPDGFFKTGDVAIWDNKLNLFKIVDRLKELIKYKGFQVPPASLEGLLLSHPEVKDVAVIGVYDDKQSTELPRAYIVPKNEANMYDAKWCADVQTWVSTRVANHSKLRGGVITIDIIPKSASGKILRRELRTLAAKQDKATAKL